MFRLAAVVAGVAALSAGALVVVGSRVLCQQGEVGCDDPPKEGAAACCVEAGVTGAPQNVRVLDASMGALREDFNAAAERWRAVLLVSPVCSECVLGARVVEREIMARYPAGNVHASVVWIPMLKGDTEETARASSGIIARENAAHFFDAQKAVGWAYHRGPFEGMARRVGAALPEDHWLAEPWAKHREDAPQWDLYMLYAPGVKWDGDKPPSPTAWIRHIGRCGDGEKSVYWRDTPDAPPHEGDLYEAMRAMADETMGKPEGDRGAAAGEAARIELLGFPGCPNTPAMRETLKAAMASLGGGWSFSEVNQQALPESDIRRGYPTPTILVNGRDLFGLPEPAEPSPGCRLYEGGLPGSSDIAARLKAAR